MPADKVLSAPQIRHGQTILIDDRAQSNGLAEYAPYIRREATTLLIAPLLARGELLGTLNVVNKFGAPTFSDDDAALLTALAGHAAVAIKNAQLLEKQKRTTERQELLENISRHLQQTLDIDTLIPRILEEVNKAINAEGQSLWLVNADGLTITCRFATGPGAESIKQHTKKNYPMGYGWNHL